MTRISPASPPIPIRLAASKIAEEEEKDFKRRTQLTQENHLKQAEILKEDQNEKLQALKTGYEQKYHLEKQKTLEAIENMDRKFQSQFQQLHDQQQSSIENIENKFNQTIRENQLNHLQKLSEYEAKTEDPFYQMAHYPAQLTEKEDRFVLSLKIPDYVKEQVNVGATQNSITISTTRGNHQKQKSEQGTEMSTSSYQNFREVFPLNHAIDPRKMTKKFNDQELVVEVFKLGTLQKKAEIEV